MPLIVSSVGFLSLLQPLFHHPLSLLVLRCLQQGISLGLGVVLDVFAGVAWSEGEQQPRPGYRDYGLDLLTIRAKPFRFRIGARSGFHAGECEPRPKNRRRIT